MFLVGFPGDVDCHTPSNFSSFQLGIDPTNCKISRELQNLHGAMMLNNDQRLEVDCDGCDQSPKDNLVLRAPLSIAL